MNKVLSGISLFLRQEEGVTAIEYSLIAFLIATVIILATMSIGINLQNVFCNVAKGIGNDINQVPAC